MASHRVRRVAWPLFGVFVLGLAGATTAWVVQLGIDAGTAVRVIALCSWCAAFAFAWRGFRRSHGEAGPASDARKVQARWAQWGPVFGVIASSVLLNLSDALQLIGLALISGFMWPGLYWVVRGFVKHPERRERLWNTGFKGIPDN